LGVSLSVIVRVSARVQHLLCNSGMAKNPVTDRIAFWHGVEIVDSSRVLIGSAVSRRAARQREIRTGPFRMDPKPCRSAQATGC
jgi:hypothetical protein